MTDHDDVPSLDELDQRAPTAAQRRMLAVAAAVVLVGGTVALVGQGDDRARIDTDELSDLEPGVLRPLGPRDGRDSIQLPITVEPSADLRDGDVVTVSGTGFEAGERVGIVQCAREAGGDAVRGGIDGCDISAVQYADADADGRAAGTYSVQRVVTTPVTGTIDCAAEPDRCIIGMGALDDYDRSGGTAVRFLPDEPIDVPTVAVGPDEGLADGQVVEVTGRGFDPGELLDVVVCSTDPGVCWTTGEPITLRSEDQRGEGESPGLRADDEGRVDGNLPVWRFQPGPTAGTYIDCAVSPCSLRITSQHASPPTVPLEFLPGGEAPTAPSLGVSSTEDLSPGDVVVVHGEGFSPGAIVWVSLCAGPPGQPELRYTCGSTSGSEQHVDGDGGIVVEFEIPDLGWEEMTATTMCPGEDCESGGPGAERSVSARCDGVESSCAITVEHHLQGAVPAPPTWAPAPVLITFD